MSFTTSADGTHIAWSRHGTGPPLVRAGTWLTHLDLDWSSPVWRHWLDALGQHFTVIRYDERGSGLSERAPNGYSMEAWVADLEAVVTAARLNRFSLLGVSQGGATAVEYAAAHPERVENLILWGAYGRGAVARDPAEEDREERNLRWQIMRVGWGRDDPVFRRVFSTRLVPGATEAQMAWFDDLQRQSMSSDAALASSQARALVDASAAAQRVSARTLALHADGDRTVPFEEGRRLAGLIPGSRFISLHSQNHLLLEDEPAWPQFVEEVLSFAGASRVGMPSSPVTIRELEVLRLVAHGCSNEQIGSRLALSVRTVERHLSNVYVKLSLSGRSARAAAVGRLRELEHGTVER